MPIANRGPRVDREGIEQRDAAALRECQVDVVVVIVISPLSANNFNDVFAAMPVATTSADPAFVRDRFVSAITSRGMSRIAIRLGF